MTTQRSTPATRRSLNPLSLWHLSLRFLIPVVCLMFATSLHAVSPAPDGGYANENTAEGQDALFSLTTGFGNTAVGYDALFAVTTGGDNTAVGVEAMISDTTGGGNTAVGFNALSDSTAGIQNTAIGNLALTANTTGNLNTACGSGALFSNTTAINNTAVGASALEFTSTGKNNAAMGTFCMANNTTGNQNTAVGFEALNLSMTGISNTAVGYQALVTSGGSSNIAIGAFAGTNLTTGSNNIDIAALGIADESNTTRLGKKGTQTNAYVAGVSGVTVARGVGVIIDTNGHLGTIVSSKRFKENIQPMAKTSEAILSLSPVTFCYKKELDPEATPQFGLVAEQVEKIDPDLVVRDEQGKPYSVRYEAVNAMLLNEFLKEHRKVEEQALKAQRQEATIAQQQETIEALEAASGAQAVQIQRISARLEETQSGAKVVHN